MNIKSILAAVALVATTSSAALADTVVSGSLYANVEFGSNAYAHGQVRDHRASSRPVYGGWQRPRPEPVLIIDNTKLGRYSEYVGPIGAPGRGGFAALTEPTRIDNSRQDFTVGAAVGGFDAIQLRGVTGMTYVRKVTIEFDNNEAQYVPVEQTLSGQRAITIDVDGRNRRIKRIFVYGETGANSAYQIFAT